MRLLRGIRKNVQQKESEVIPMYSELIKELREYWNDGTEDIRNQAADAIEELQKITTHYEEESKGWWLAACDAKEERERLKEQIPKWIPVTERLPEIDMSYPHHEAYLVQYDSGNMDVASWSNVNRFWTGHVTEPHWNCVQFAEVIAWMPLPEPPKEE